jgi:predicted enzyme related to lactoylglutathione lyase
LKPSISIITIGVDDLERAFTFYRALLDIADEQIAPGEDHVAFFFADNFSFVLFPRDQIAQTAGQDNAVAGTPGFVLSHQAASPAEVNDILHKVLIAGGAIIMEGTQSEWGYSAYFEDTEGNIWELMAQPEPN